MMHQHLQVKAKFWQSCKFPNVSVRSCVKFWRKAEKPRYLKALWRQTGQLFVLFHVYISLSGPSCVEAEIKCPSSAVALRSEEGHRFQSSWENVDRERNKHSLSFNSQQHRTCKHINESTIHPASGSVPRASEFVAD